MGSSTGNASVLLCAGVVSINADEEEGDSGEAISQLYKGLIRPTVEEFGGQIAGSAGDGLVVEFPNGPSAIESAVALHRGLAEQVGDTETGLQLGIDKPSEPGRIDTVLRLQEMATPEAIFISGRVRDDVPTQLDLGIESLGEHPLGEEEDSAVYRLTENGEPGGSRSVVKKLGLAAIPLATLGLARLAPSSRRRDVEEPAAPNLAACEVCGAVHVPAAQPASPDLTPETVDIEIVGGTPEQRELAESALSLFDEYDLPLPDLEIYFHTLEDKEEACGGHVALARLGGETDQIDMCGTTATTLFHELAHVWAFHGLNDVQQDAFLELRGLEAWGGSDVRWGLRGSEHAANVIAWGLQSDPVRPGGTLPNDDDSLADAFRLLTGGKTPASLVEIEVEAAGELPDVEEAPLPAAAEPAGRPDTSTTAGALEEEPALDQGLEEAELLGSLAEGDGSLLGDEEPADEELEGPKDFAPE